MSSCLFAGLIMALVTSWRNLSGLEVELLPPDFCFAGQQAFLRCKIENDSVRPRFSLAFGDDYAAIIPAKSLIILKSDFTAGGRGKYHTSQMKVFSCYPVDLFFTRIELPEIEVAIGPKPEFSRIQALAESLDGNQQRLMSGKEGDYWMQSHYREGDDSSIINWKISARSTHEWVLVKSVNFGSSRRLYFSLAALDPKSLEMCLMRIMGLLLHLKRHQTEVFVWADTCRNGYAWLSVNGDMAQIVNWLACYQCKTEIVPPDDGTEAVELEKLMV